MSGIRGIFSNLASALQSRAKTEQSSTRQLPAAVLFSLTGADAAIRSMLERMAQTNAVAPSRAQTAEKPKVQTVEVKPMYEGVKTTAELNQRLLKTIEDVDPQPTGLKPHGKQRGGVAESEAAAELHAQYMPKHDLKAKFERLGEKYSVPPALIAAIASRESNMGTQLKRTGVYTGWGDFSKRRGEKHKSYHGFGIIQVDRQTAPFPEIRRELQAAYGKRKLDPYAEEHIEWGVKCFLKKLDEARTNNPKLPEAEQIATAVSKYNGGKRGAVYPENDARTSGHDYANDTLIRARWFAQDWDSKVK